MRDLLIDLPRERLDALNGWKPLRPPVPEDGLLPDGPLLHLATAQGEGPDGPILAQPVPDTEADGSFGGRSLPRGVAVSSVGDIYLVDPDAGRLLYTRASLPPEAPTDSPVAPFVPLWSFQRPPEADHPLNLGRPVDLCLIPDTAPPGAFGDCLVIADAGRNLLIWLDRRQIVVRHVLQLPGRPLSCAAGPTGQIAVLIERTETQELLRIDRGRRLPAVILPPGAAHSVIGLLDGSFLLIGRAGLSIVATSGHLLPVSQAPDLTVTAPAFVLRGEVLQLRGSCECMADLPYPHLPLDRFGRLAGTALPLVTRPRRLPRPRTGRWISQRFDGEARGFAWDRITLEMTIPPQCRLLVSTFVSDLAHEPDTIAQVAAWTPPMVFEPGTPSHFLVQRNRGRYLWLRIEAFGDGAASPVLRGIDIHGPRDSQIGLLPTPFHVDPVSADFLDRFLSLQDAFLREALAAFSSMAAILRPDATPSAFLEWIGGWFDWRFLADWDSATRRDMIANSITFFAQRGTITGLEGLLRWHTGLAGPLPRVLEEFRLAQAIAAGDTGFLGGLSRAPEEAGAHRFCVLLPEAVVPDPEARAVLMRLIDAQKPAHTQCRVIVLAPGFVPGKQARLGLDAILPSSRPPPLGAGRLDEDLQTVATC